MSDDSPAARGPLSPVRSGGDILPLALAAAARSGDTDPELVQHIKGTREDDWIVGRIHPPEYYRSTAAEVRAAFRRYVIDASRE